MDPDGHSVILSIFAGAVLRAIIGAATSCAVQLSENGKEINWKKVALDASIEAIGGAFTGGGAGVALSAIVGGTLSVAGSIGHDLIDSGGNWSKVRYDRVVLLGVSGAIIGGVTAFLLSSEKIFSNFNGFSNFISIEKTQEYQILSERTF